MTNRLLNAMKMQALLAANGLAAPRFGTIDSYNKKTFSVKVLIQPEGVITGWIPLGTPWVGNGWGMFAAPSIGDLVRVDFAGGDPDAGLASLRAYSDVNVPLGVESGEFWLIHKSGSGLKFHNDGSVDVISADKLNITTGDDTTVNVTGKLTAAVSGDVIVTSGGKATVNANECDVTAPQSTWTGNLSVVGLLTAGSLAVTGSSGGATTAAFQVPITSTGEITANGHTLTQHKHSVTGIQTGVGSVNSQTPTG